MFNGNRGQIRLSLIKELDQVGSVMLIKKVKELVASFKGYIICTTAFLFVVI